MFALNLRSAEKGERVAVLEDIKAFGIADADIALWTFKKQSPKGEPPQYNGHWVDTTADMDEQLRQIVAHQLNNILEEREYGLLTENNEASVLRIALEETHAGLIANEIVGEINKRKVKDVKTLRNCAFYVIKLVNGENILYCARKTDASWKTKSAFNAITAVFSEKQLDVVSDEDFKIQKSIDFFWMNEDLLIKSKDNFESILNYKEAHEKDFEEMIKEDEFTRIFSDVGVLSNFVGSNKINLRRMSAIRQKGFYKNKMFMDNLRKDYEKFNLKISFDAAGRFVPTPENCREIISALLDHRLISGFSGNIYDVQDAIPV